MVKLSNTTLELITPLDESSPLKNFLKKNPQGGLHHLCYEVLDIQKARDTLITAGLRVIGDGNPIPGYHGNPVLFFHPKDFFGALIELEEIGPSKDQKPLKNQPVGVIHTSPHHEGGSLDGIEGVGIAIEVDFKCGTPKDNEERE
jgi:catechol 2,3-dioxygenase-like lactoylglutathione lyase family enzyme